MEQMVADADSDIRELSEKIKANQERINKLRQANKDGGVVHEGKQFTAKDSVIALSD